MINELVKVTGKLDIIRTDKNNNVVESIHVPNLVVYTGKVFIASRMTSNTGLMSHMAIGTSDTAAVVGQTAIVTEIARVALSGQSSLNNIVTYTATFGPGVGTGPLKEAGIFAASSGGIMLCRTVFNVINKNPDDTMNISWAITIS